MNFLDQQFGRLGNRLFQCAYIYAQMRDCVIPDIYLQDPKYFDKYEQEIKQLFGQGIVPDERVAIHVRRGDYVNNPFYMDLTQTDYYGTAETYFPNDKFLVFSDNIEWCKHYFWRIGVYDFSEGKSADEDLRLMAGCKSIIMANSSLSWWGAYLGNHEKVIYPAQWFADGIQRVGFKKEWLCV